MGYLSGAWQIQKCLAREIFDDPRGPELLEAYASECANALVGKPAPRLDLYEAVELTGMGQCFSLRREGELRGFAMVLVSVVPHYDLRCATTESLFVERGSPGGWELMREIEQYAREAGCVSFFYVAPAGSRFAKLLFLSGSDYENTNQVFCRNLA